MQVTDTITTGIGCKPAGLPHHTLMCGLFRKEMHVRAEKAKPAQARRDAATCHPMTATASRAEIQSICDRYTPPLWRSAHTLSVWAPRLRNLPQQDVDDTNDSSNNNGSEAGNSKERNGTNDGACKGLTCSLSFKAQQHGRRLPSFHYVRAFSAREACLPDGCVE